MKGDVVATNYFGDQIEERDNDTPMTEIVGSVRVKKFGTIEHAYIKFDEVVYDLPQFMKHYKNQRVALLCRKFKKEKHDKLFNKLIIIKAIRI